MNNLKRVSFKNKVNTGVERVFTAGLAFILLLTISACNQTKVIEPNQSETTSQDDGIGQDTSTEVKKVHTLQPVDSFYTKEVKEYTNDGVRQTKTATFSSKDGLCVIDVYPDYFDVTLDYTLGSRKEVGAAYAATIKKAYPDYEAAMEPYIFENIRIAFSGQQVDYKALEKRMYSLLNSIDASYQDEIKGYAEEMSSGQNEKDEPEEHGFMENGKLSYEEAIIAQMVPDALRGTACSALSLWGSKTVTGKGITLRCLEWNLGSENQMCGIHAVVHMKNNEKTITSINMLGLLDMISAVNDDGVFVGILDIGSKDAVPFVYEGKTCYTYAIRYALENYDNATDVGNYMVQKSGDFTWCHNLIITDETSSYCAEDCVSEVSDIGQGFSILRDADTKLMPGLNWKSKDSLCVLNSFASDGNQDQYSQLAVNIVRFEKYNKWVSEREKFSVADVKDMITQEKTEQYEVENVHRNTAVHLVLIDYATGNIQVAFTGEEGVVDKPDFIDVGNY